MLYLYSAICGATEALLTERSPDWQARDVAPPTVIAREGLRRQYPPQDAQNAFLTKNCVKFLFFWNRNLSGRLTVAMQGSVLPPPRQIPRYAYGVVHFLASFNF